ncbi:HNH endonuclease [Amycolatopsis albispora]|uniref:HNH nuclease domain-containing protein n=1 Tax=Amycolatopsis albispora TaxID=1804986 RepID=A0A344L7F5_9PSEU|nr:HNH endonuclease signature motif containing protein [Amycolatopsis albispora]AXB43979.1 hypothetical protein A4R43_16795 [Amycolatopsis albispora]
MDVSHKQIVDYWAAVEDESGLAVDWAEAHERCWRCGYRSRLERCHIIPDSLGGRASPDNLVLLCGRCHREAPNHAEPEYMWRWLRATCVPLYDTYWTIRGTAEFEVMFGRKPLECLLAAGIAVDELTDGFRAVLKDEFARAVIHFGEGRLNPSTIACIMAEAERKLAHHHGVTLPDEPVTRANQWMFGARS